MSEQIDEAQALAERFIESSLHQQQLRAHSSQAEPAGGPRDCECCGEPIPPARLKVVPCALLCVECQTFQERRQHG